ncbi:MAG: HD domain-containing protein [Lachnospiraceae bacterium]|nr:HD domain-containing protein [Lachnospiraceae bacterium]
MSRKDERLIKTIAVLISILETRDENLSGHSLHIEKLADAFFEVLPLRYHFRVKRNDLRLAALLHDIGQSCVPPDTLGKAGKLTPSEKERIKQHPDASVSLLECMSGYDKILEGVKYHHERMDGRGYYGLKGHGIPLIARILAILDTFSAVTVLRTYKPTRTYEDGISTLKLGSGSQFDEELVDIFLSIPRSRVMECFSEVEDNIKSLEDKGIIL